MFDLSSRFTDDFHRDTQLRGVDYLHRGRVTLEAGGPAFVRATVHGGQPYRVSLHLDDEALDASCTCPFFEKGEPCKHLWATLLAAEHAGYLKELQDVLDPHLRLPHDLQPPPEDDDDLGLPTGPIGSRSHRRALPPYPGTSPGGRPRASAVPTPRAEEWESQLEEIAARTRLSAYPRSSSWPSSREILYVIDLAATLDERGLAIDLMARDRKANGDWGKPKPRRIRSTDIGALPSEADREILAMLLGARQDAFGYHYGDYQPGPSGFRLPGPLERMVVPAMCRTGRCYLLRRRLPELEMLQIGWDDGPPWEFEVDVAETAEREYAVSGWLRRGSERISVAEPHLLLSSGLMFSGSSAARLSDSDAFGWISLLRRDGTIVVPLTEADRLLGRIFQLPRVPPLQLPKALAVERVAIAAVPRLTIRAPFRAPAAYLPATLAFQYGETTVQQGEEAVQIYEAHRQLLVTRDAEAERHAAARLVQLGLRPNADQYGSPGWLLATRRLAATARTLVSEGWRVEAQGKLYRNAGRLQTRVHSGIDWFELHGDIDFEGQKVPLPQLLAAVKRGEHMVPLADGSVGVLPEDWLRELDMVLAFGEAEGDHFRFTRAQTGLLDALLAAQTYATADESFTRARDALRSFEGIAPMDPPSGFIGTLREYQREGLGWLHFLQRFGFGGCLADDMGLGKTVMVLALLESRREQQPGRPSLIVVPRSIVYNWKQEAARFTPALRILDFTGAGRGDLAARMSDTDIVITTYGTLRRDVLQLKDVEFDYIVLDEAQFIKNAASDSSKASRLLRGSHRLALSGTPIENHLGELWSLFDFLNPGLLGTARAFNRLHTGARRLAPEEGALLASALRPFILRRTKERVARDLPQRVEQTIYCELDANERRLYDELREHYRRSLIERIDRQGVNRSKMQILEALLRLRQAACHPGLIDRARSGASSAKLEVLLPQLAEVVEEGHKALVFSQFTTMLGILRARLDAQGIEYEYLDGRTVDRQARVERFQTDPARRLFLISLKAGGVGLNLTAADYVFLLDPWWNPAVEAQAIDRTHRIGQTRPVFAYRLIARDTVEEKVLQLQQSKRDLADAIIRADESLIRTLGREELEMLLS